MLSAAAESSVAFIDWTGLEKLAEGMEPVVSSFFCVPQLTSVTARITIAVPRSNRLLEKDARPCEFIANAPQHFLKHRTKSPTYRRNLRSSNNLLTLTER